MALPLRKLLFLQLPLDKSNLILCRSRHINKIFFFCIFSLVKIYWINFMLSKLLIFIISFEPRAHFETVAFHSKKNSMTLWKVSHQVRGVSFTISNILFTTFAQIFKIHCLSLYSVYVFNYNFLFLSHNSQLFYILLVIVQCHFPGIVQKPRLWLKVLGFE